MLHEHNDANDNALLNTAIASEINLHGDPLITLADTVRAAGNSPNTVLSAACAVIGPDRVNAARAAVDVFMDLFGHTGLDSCDQADFDLSRVVASPKQLSHLVSDVSNPKAEAMLAGLVARGTKSVLVDYLKILGKPPTADAVLAAITTSVCWSALMRKKITLITAHNLPWYTRLSVIIGASVPSDQHQAEHFCGVANQDLINSWSTTEIAYLALLGETRPQRNYSSSKYCLG